MSAIASIPSTDRAGVESVSIELLPPLGRNAVSLAIELLLESPVLDDESAAANLMVRANRNGFPFDRKFCLYVIQEVRAIFAQTSPAQAVRLANSTGKAKASAVPLFDPRTTSFDRFIHHDPPNRPMIIPGFLPRDVVGVLASMGGAGKSTLLLTLCFCVAMGIDFLGMPIREPGGALYISAEDDEDELHRRGRELLNHFGPFTGVHATALRRLHVVSRVSENNLFTTARDREVERTPLADMLIAAAREIPDLKLIVLGPVSRLRGGNPNAEEDTTRFVETLEYIRKQTGACLLVDSHVSKGSLRDKRESDQSDVRGSSALVDGVRWCATMQRLRKDSASGYGIDEQDAHRYVRLELAKSNYTAEWPGLWLERCQGGLLVPAKLEEQRESRRKQRQQDRGRDLLPRICKLLSERGPMTESQIWRGFSGTDGLLKAGAGTVRAIVRHAVQEGDLVECGRKTARTGGKLLMPRGAA